MQIHGRYKTQLVWFLSAHLSSVLRLRMLAEATQFCCFLHRLRSGTRCFPVLLSGQKEVAWGVLRCISGCYLRSELNLFCSFRFAIYRCGALRLNWEPINPPHLILCSQSTEHYQSQEGNISVSPWVSHTSQWWVARSLLGLHRYNPQHLSAISSIFRDWNLSTHAVSSILLWGCFKPIPQYDR